MTNMRTAAVMCVYCAIQHIFALGLVSNQVSGCSVHGGVVFAVTLTINLSSSPQLLMRGWLSERKHWMKFHHGAGMEHFHSAVR